MNWINRYIKSNSYSLARLLIIFIFLLSVIMDGTAQEQTGPYIAFKYMVKVKDGSIGYFYHNISPRYLWLDDHRLVIPVREVVGRIEEYELIDIDLFVLDLTNGTAVKAASYENIIDIDFSQSERGDVLLLSTDGYHQTDQSSLDNSRIISEYAAVNIATLEIMPLTRETYFEQQVSGYSYEVESNSTQSNNNEQVARYGWGIPSFYWGDDYITALSLIPGLSPPLEYDIRLYHHDASTAYVLPHVSVYAEHAVGYPEILQLSPGGSLLFLNENLATYTVRDVFELRGSGINSIISIYGFTDEDPTEYYDTMVYTMDDEDFGKDYAVGEVFKVDREIIDGSIMSTGPVSASP